MRISAANAASYLDFLFKGSVFLHFFFLDFCCRCSATLIYFQLHCLCFSLLILFCSNICCQCSYLDFLFKGNASLATTPEGLAELVGEMERAMHTLRSCIEPLVLRCRILHRSFFLLKKNRGVLGF